MANRSTDGKLSDKQYQLRARSLQRLKTSNTQRPTPNVELGKALAASEKRNRN
jgi:hypothetical protein